MMFNKSAVPVALFALAALISPLAALAQVATSTATTTPATDPYNRTEVEAAVRSYFADLPVLAAIAKCESNFRQYAADGAPLNGGSGGMLGVFQINKSVHAKFALSLGDDISTLAGNMAYARYLYTQEGTAPWNSSKGCWGPVTKVSAGDANIATVSATLKLGTVSPQVAALQKMLNAAGYLVAKKGPGSPGHETAKFGIATKAAVQRFQCAHGIVCKGTPATTGYGLVGAKTRTALARAGASFAKA